MPTPPSTVAPSRLELELARLRRDYLRGLDERGRELVDAVERVRRDPAQRERIEHARGLAHRLCGTAGSYGFGAVGVAAGEVEGLLDPARPPSVDAAMHAARRVQALCDDPMRASGEVAGAFDDVCPTVLLIDDALGALGEVEALVASSRWSVARCREPSQIGGQLEIIDPALIIVANELAVLGGLDLCRVVRASDRGRSTPLVLIGGGQDPASRHAAMLAGVDEVVATPVVEAELRRRVDQQLARGVALRRWRERDPATGLLRRAAFLARVADDLAVGPGRAPAVVLLSVVGLVEHDRAVGYRLLHAVEAELGRLIRASFAPPTIAGRWRDGIVAIVVPGAVDEPLRRQLAQLAATFRLMRSEAAGWGDELTLAWATVVATAGEGIEAMIRQAERQLE